MRLGFSLGINRLALRHALPIAGMLATALPTDGTIHYHVGTAALTMLGGNASFLFSGSGSTMTVAAGGTGDAIVKGMVLAVANLPEGSRVIGIGTYTHASGGTVTVTDGFTAAVPAGTAGTASGAKVVVGVADARGVAALTNTDGLGPLLVTDGLGRKALRFTASNGQNYGTWLKATGLPGFTTANATWFMVTRLHASSGSSPSQTLVTLTPNGRQPLFVRGGTDEGYGVRVPTPVVCGPENGMQVTLAADRKKLLVGSNLSVVGTSAANDTAGSCYIRYYANEQVVSKYGATDPSSGQTGFVLGSNAPSGVYSSTYDVYELVAWLGTEFTVANYVAGADAASAALRSNWGTVAYTDRLILMADSRTQENYHDGLSTGMVLTEPGSALALPATTQVINAAISGATVQTFAESLEEPLGLFSPDLMMGGGKDRVLMFFGVNEMTNNEPIWPSTYTTYGTDARADEAYDGSAALSAVFTGYANSAYQITVTAVTSGVIRPFMVLGGTGLTGVGRRILSQVSGTTGGAGVYNISASISGGSSGAPLTLRATWTSYRRNAQMLIDRGYKLIIAVDLNRSSGSAQATARERLRNYQRNIAADMGAGNAGLVKIADLPKIMIGGAKPFGDDDAAMSLYFRDYTTHPTDLGRLRLVDGGDTPAKGMKAAIVASLAT